MKSLQGPVKEIRPEKEESVPQIPTEDRHRRAIWMVVTDTREYGEHEIRQSKESDGNSDNAPHNLVGRKEEHHEAGKK